MRRHDGLIPLTHDHHHGLAQARRLRIAANGSDEERLRASETFIDFFRTEALAHFREEEEVVFPLAVDRPGAEAFLERVMIEHLRIHAIVARLEHELQSGKVSQETATDAAAALRSHIRFEETEVFPMIERVVPEDELEILAVRLGEGSERPDRRARTHAPE
jgi:hemerythrin-like domain-containing protein